jgi:hypothetical protein
MARRGEAAPRRLDGRRLVTAGGRLRGLGIAWSSGGSQEIDAQGAAQSSQSGNRPSITAVHDHGVGGTVLLQLTKQPVWLLQLEVRSGLSEAGRSRAVAVAVWIGGAVKTSMGTRQTRGVRSGFRVPYQGAAAGRHADEVNRDAGSDGGASAFGVEDEFMPQGRRYRRISCEMDIGIEAGSLEGTSVRVVR